MKKSNIVRVLLVLMAMSPSSMAAIYSAVTGPNTGAPAIHAFKPSDVIFPGFIQTDLRQRPEDNRGFSGFLEEVRNAVNSTRGGASLTDRAEDASLANRRRDKGQSRNATYESSTPIKLEPNSSTGATTEVYLGVSVKQIVSEIPPAGTIILERPTNGTTENRARGKGSYSGSVKGGALGSGGSWLRGGFLSTGEANGLSGFGFDLQPMSFPTDQGTGAIFGAGPGEIEVTKGLKALRRIVLDLVFNPFVYFGGLIIAVFMFMARFRSTSA
ncbi:MAG: hypothetical protein O3C34_00610 [Proteobacteria bacterium]|nr:hypothetical protein [Pseudomonadota bacterium]